MANPNNPSVASQQGLSHEYRFDNIINPTKLEKYQATDATVILKFNTHGEATGAEICLKRTSDSGVAEETFEVDFKSHPIYYQSVTLKRHI